MYASIKPIQYKWNPLLTISTNFLCSTVWSNERKVKKKKKINPLCKTISLEDLQVHTVWGSSQPAAEKPLFQASASSHRTWGEILTSVNTLAVLWMRLVFGKAAMEIAGRAFFKLWVQAWQHTLGLFSSRDTKRLFKCHQQTPNPYPKHSAAPAEKGVICECLRCPKAVVCATECAFVTLCVMTVNESGSTLNMTLAIYGINLPSHGPQTVKCSVT